MNGSWSNHWLRTIILAFFAVSASWSGYAEAEEEDEYAEDEQNYTMDEEDYGENSLFSLLGSSALSLSDAIGQAEEASGTPISAKFEMDGDKLKLSIVTSPDGLEEDAEGSALSKLSGDPTESSWSPEAETLTDMELLTRSATHLTALRLCKLTLAEAIEKAEAEQAGTVYSAEPAFRDDEPVIEVLVATSDHEDIHLIVDGLTGDVSRE